MLTEVDCANPSASKEIKRHMELCDRSTWIDMQRRNWWIRCARTKCEKEVNEFGSCGEITWRRLYEEGGDSNTSCGKIRFPQETLGSMMLIKDQVLF